MARFQFHQTKDTYMEYNKEYWQTKTTNFSNSQTVNFTTYTPQCLNSTNLVKQHSNKHELVKKGKEISTMTGHYEEDGI